MTSYLNEDVNAESGGDLHVNAAVNADAADADAVLMLLLRYRVHCGVLNRTDKYLS